MAGLREETDRQRRTRESVFRERGKPAIASGGPQTGASVTRHDGGTVSPSL